MFAAKRIIGECSSKAVEVNLKNNSVKTIKKETKTSLGTKTTPETKNASEPEKQLIQFNKDPKAFGLDETCIPDELIKNAKVLQVKGDLKGWYFLIHYDGKLKNYLDKPMEPYHALLMRKGQLKKIIVSVSKSDKTIYIHDNFYEIYKQGINDVIELSNPS